MKASQPNNQRISEGTEKSFAEAMAELKDLRERMETSLLIEISVLESTIRELQFQEQQFSTQHRKKMTEAKEELECMEKEFSAEQDKRAREFQMELQKLDAVIETNTKIIVQLRKKLNSAKKEEEKLRRKVDQLTTVNRDIEHNSFSLAECVELVGNATEEENYSRNDYLDQLDSEKKAHNASSSLLQKQQRAYMDQAEERLALQKCLAKILTIVQDSDQDVSLQEEVTEIAFHAQDETKAIMMALQCETSEPSLMFSEASDSFDTDF